MSIGDVATRQVWRTIEPRVTCWVNPDGTAVVDGGRTVRLDMSTVETMLDGVPVDVRQVMVTGRPRSGWADLVDWARPGRWLDGGSWLSPEAPVWRRQLDGRAVDVRMAAGWWGDGAAAADVEAAWRRLGELIGRRFGGATLLASPGATGRELLARSISDGAEWWTIGDDLAGLLREWSPQGRTELVEHQGQLDQVVEYDGRMMYGALCRGLPGGLARRRVGAAADPADRMAAGWVHGRVVVPGGWEHVGLLPCRSSDGWVWPSTPGHSWAGWWSTVEVDLARRWGWVVDVDESWIHDPYDGPGPTDRWHQRLLAARDEAEGDPLVAGAVRAILVQTIGAWWATGRDVTRSAPLDAADLPMGDHVQGLRVDGDRWVWSERTGAAWPAMVHPEWSATVWARCRARLLDGPGAGRTRTGALHLPAGSVVAFRTDAIWSTVDPGWRDDGRVGRLRHRGTYSGPHEAPTDHHQLLAIRAGS